MLNSDRAPEADAPLYGTHPFYIQIENETTIGSGLTIGSPMAHGVMLFNNNPQDVVLTPTPSVTYRTIGGVLDFYLYLGPSFDDVVGQHMELTGRPPLPPMWGLGFHLCRYGYNSIENTRAAWTRTRDAKVSFHWSIRKVVKICSKSNHFRFCPFLNHWIRSRSMSNGMTLISMINSMTLRMITILTMVCPNLLTNSIR